MGVAVRRQHLVRVAVVGGDQQRRAGTGRIGRLDALDGVRDPGQARVERLERLERRLVFALGEAPAGLVHGGANTRLLLPLLDGRLGGDLGSSAAQSVVLMLIVVGLTAVQFRYIERRVTY